MNKQFSIVIAYLFCQSFAFAQTKEQFDYPELMVSPAASVRLLMEAKKEQQQSLFFQIPFQVSALSTFLAGVAQLSGVNDVKDPDNNSAKAGLIVGSVWLGLNVYLGQGYKMYRNSYQELKLIKGETAKDRLAKERLAEEAFSRAASMASRMKWLSFTTNSAVSIFMVSKAKKDTMAQVLSGFSVLAGLGPLIFESEWERVAREQRSYKKKVYGPILTTGLFQVGNQFSPGLLFKANF